MNGDRIAVAISCWDCPSSMLTELAGFDIVNVGSGSIEGALTGSPDAELGTLTEKELLIANIAEVVDLPILVDMDTGWGHPVQMMRAITKLEKAGAAGVYIEDQAIPKGCGMWKNVRSVSEEEMKLRIEACTEARQDENFVIMVKPGGLSTIGLDEYIERSKKYEKWGADCIHEEAAKNVDELKAIASELKCTLVNAVAGGKTPILTIEDYEEMGYNIVKFTGSNYTYLAAVKDYLAVLKKERTDRRILEKGSTYTLDGAFAGMWDLYRLPKWQEIYRRFYPDFRDRVKQGESLVEAASKKKTL